MGTFEPKKQNPAKGHAAIGCLRPGGWRGRRGRWAARLRLDLNPDRRTRLIAFGSSRGRPNTPAHRLNPIQIGTLGGHGIAGAGHSDFSRLFAGNFNPDLGCDHAIAAIGRAGLGISLGTSLGLGVRQGAQSKQQGCPNQGQTRLHRRFSARNGPDVRLAAFSLKAAGCSQFCQIGMGTCAIMGDNLTCCQ